jgi:hypothetical protein
MKDVIELAREAGFEIDCASLEWHRRIERFARLHREQVLEEAAEVCDAQGQGRKALEHYASLTYAGAAHDCAAAIRALKGTT